MKADAILELANLNLTSEQLAGVLRILATQERAEEERKAKDRARKKTGNSTEIPRKETEKASEPMPEPTRVDNKITNTTQVVTEIIPPVVPPLTSKPTMRAPRGTRLPDDWQPRRNEIEFARAAGYLDQEIIDMADHFRDHFLASADKNAIKIDWDKAFRNWIRRDIKDRKRNGTTRRNSMAESWAIASQVLAEQDRREGVRREGDEDDHGLLPGLRQDAA